MKIHINIAIGKLPAARGTVILVAHDHSPVDLMDYTFAGIAAVSFAGLSLHREYETRQSFVNAQERDTSLNTIRKLSAAIEHSPSSIVITDPAGDIEYVNQRFVDMTGYTREEVLGHNPRVLNSGRQKRTFYRGMWQTITAGKT